MRFDPILPNHAIERSAITLTFGEALPEKLFQREMDRLSSSVQETGLAQRPRANVGFVVDINTGNVSREPAANAPFVFAADDGSTQFTIMPNALTWVTTAYSRWRPFLRQFLETSHGVRELFTSNLDLSTVKVECWDRFIWLGEWGDIKYEALFSQNSGYIVPNACKGGREWHSHTGWFSFAEESIRRLTNINIDAVEILSTINGEKRPSVGIYTMIQDELPRLQEEVSSDNSQSLEGRLHKLHVDLKNIFGELVTPDVKARVGLEEHRR